MIIDGSVVVAGDGVFDILLGAGVVEAPGADSCTVRFDASRRLVYYGNGAVSGVKRLYWARPIMMVPRKDDPRTRVVAAVIATLLQEIA